MPKQTFFNLPEAKRQAFLEAAIDEFSQHDYRDVSMARLAGRAGIAKGSIYQYFADKRDLFTYLLELASQEKIAVLRDLPPEPGMNFFDYLRWLAASAGRVTLAHPGLAAVGYRAYYGDLPFRDEIIAQVKEASRQYFDGMVQKAIADGDIDPAVDPAMAGFVLNTLMAELGNFLMRSHGVDPAEVGRHGELTFDLQVVERAVDDLTRVLQYGLASPAHRRAPLPADGAGN